MNTIQFKAPESVVETDKFGIKRQNGVALSIPLRNIGESVYLKQVPCRSVAELLPGDMVSYISINRIMSEGYFRGNYFTFRDVPLLMTSVVMLAEVFTMGEKGVRIVGSYKKGEDISFLFQEQENGKRANYDRAVATFIHKKYTNIEFYFGDKWTPGWDMVTKNAFALTGTMLPASVNTEIYYDNGYINNVIPFFITDAHFEKGLIESVSRYDSEKDQVFTDAWEEVEKRKKPY